MLSLSYNGIESNYEYPHELMNVNSFVSTFGYNIDKLYIDKFWSSIDNNDWIIIDYDMLKWIGYTYARDRDNKRKYLELLINNFNKHIDYDELSRSAIHERVPKGALNNLSTNTIVVRADSFKKSLMMVRTDKAKQIRDYFITLEKIFINYLKYTNRTNEFNKTIECAKLNSSLDEYRDKITQMESTQVKMEALRVNDSPIEYNEHVYILTSKRYYALNLFKIGKTKDLKTRLVGYNTGNALDNDQHFYLCSIKTSDSRALEKQIHMILNNFHYNKEWYRINPIDLLSVIKFITAQQEHLKLHMDNIIKSQLTDKQSLTIDEFANLSNPKKETTDGYYEQSGRYFCSICTKDYKTLGRIQNHIDNDSCRESKVGSYECPKCSKQFVVKHYFDLHCSEDSCLETIYKCGDCSKSYLSKKCYEKHITNGCNRFTCDRCKKICNSKHDLIKHMNRKNPCTLVE